MLPPDSVTESLIRRMGSLYHRLGNEIGERPLVVPNGTYFPDPFTGDEESVGMLLHRMQGHAGLQDVPLELRIVSHAQGCPDCDGNCKQAGGSCACKQEASAAQKSCASGSCGSCGPVFDEPVNEPRLVDLGDGWRIQIPAAELGNNIVLTANLAKTLGLVLLLDTRPPGQVLDDANLDVACETAGVALGFGGLLLAASFLYSKGCGGPRVTQLTKLSCGELAVLTVLFAERNGHKLRELKRALAVTQVSALDEALVLLRSNPSILGSLRSRPHELAGADFKLSAGGGFWSRWFKSKPTNTQVQNTSSEFDIRELESALLSQGAGARPARATPATPKQDDLRDLVDEALAEATRDGL